MKRSKFVWQIAGFVFTGIFGTLLHFVYELTGGSEIAALFSGVNESTWEHMKLLYFPMMIFTFIEGRFLSEKYKNYYPVKLLGIIFGLLLIPVLYYGYTGAFGVSYDFINILIFFVSAAAAYFLEYKLLSEEGTRLSSRTAIVLILLIGVFFVVFTFTQPKIPLFEDPVTNTYGIPE